MVVYKTKAPVAQVNLLPHRFKEVNPLQLIKEMWPDYKLSREQKMMVVSVWRNVETIVPAGNQLGKDFISALIILVFFLTRSPCRIVVTSANDNHLDVIRTEINQHIANARIPLTYDKGGPLRVTQEQITRDDANDKKSYIKFMVASLDRTDALAGHHAYPRDPYEAEHVPHTLAVVDEASSVRDVFIDKLRSWCRRLLIIGNPYPCDNYFKHAVKGRPGSPDKGGDIPSDKGDGTFTRKIIRIQAVDSPNIRIALAQLAMGMKAGDQGFAPLLIPGLRDYGTYVLKRQTLDKILQCVQLDADFYEGSELKLWPPEWLNHCADLAVRFARMRRWAKALGVDTAEGGDKTAFTVGDEMGVLECLSLKTPDTNIIHKMVIALGRKYNVSPHNWIFDRGGGGKVHADRLRADGYPVRTIDFGQRASSNEPKNTEKHLQEKLEEYEERTIYESMRAEMYAEFSLRCDPRHPLGGYAIPLDGDACVELHRQLSYMPKLYGSDGKLYMLPKNKRRADAKLGEKTLSELLGCSPDEADSAVLMYWGLTHQQRSASASASVAAPMPQLIPR
jgi:hypothetical protein